MRIFEIYLDLAWHDISHLYVPASLTIQRSGINSDRKSSVTSCSFSLHFNDGLYNAILEEENEVPIRIYDETHDVMFYGQMDPVLSTSWQDSRRPETLSVECVDFSVKLDEYISQSASYPSKVGGAAFWIYNPEDKSSSILYRVLELAGLSDRIDKNAPAIMQTIKHVAWNTGTTTYRTIIDNLLSDYGWVMLIRGDMITFAQTAVSQMEIVDEIQTEDIVGHISKDKTYIVANGVSVSWPKTKIMDDALLWRGNLPIGDTANPRPGEPIAQGDYWPEDSDIIETWMDYGTDYLDVDWLEGKTRLKNDEITLISSSDWVLTDSKDDEVVIDPINDSFDVVYEALRARLRYKNTADEPKRLYWSQINGRALIKTHKIKTVTPEDASNPEEYETTYIYNQDSAVRLAQIRYMWLKKGCFTFAFQSEKVFLPGEYYYLFQPELYDGYIQITAVSETDGNPVKQYSAVSTESFRKVKTISTGSSGSGTASPGQDGASYRYVYKRSFTQPPTPVGVNPEGWTFDLIPQGTEPVWMSRAQFSSTGKILIDWTTPVRESGIPANTVKYIYKRAFNQPEIPVGDTPAGWTLQSIPDGYQPVWMSVGQFSETGNLVGSWTVPVRVSAEKEGAYRGAVSVLPSDSQNGDYIIWTGATNTQMQQYHIYKYVAIDDEWVETTESDKVMGCQKDALQIAKDTHEVIYAAALFVDILVANKLQVGGGDEYSGLLVRFMDDAGDGKPLIEIMSNGKRLFYLDIDTGKLYASFAEVVQYMPYTFNDSLDPSHPAVFDFFVPEGKVDWIKVRVKSQPFRTYSIGTTLEAKTSTTNGFFDQGITKEYWLTDDSQNYYTGDNGDHSHSYQAPPNTTESAKAGVSGKLTGGGFNDGKHGHNVSVNTTTGNGSTSGYNDGVHGHDYSIEIDESWDGHEHSIDSVNSNTSTNGEHNHTYRKQLLKDSGSYTHEHTVNISHNHGIKLGIIEGASSSGMTLSFDNRGSNTFTSSVSVTSGQEITKEEYPDLGNITSNGWKQIKITSTSLGRVQVQLILKMRIDTDY